MIGQTISHYRVLAVLGEGGMGTVYVAEDTRLGRRVALKLPHADKTDRHYRARFLREARAVSRLTHPGIAAVYDYGETEEGQPYIVMELVAGRTLGELLMASELTLARAAEVIIDVAEALSEAHRRGVVHRDIKPSNVIVDDQGAVKVLDFGLAKHLDGDDGGEHASPEARSLLATRTRSDVVIGTPLYLSPEQARGLPVDARSDLFSLGALLYECVAGRPAFSGSSLIEIGAEVLHVNPQPPSRFNPRVPTELDRVVMKALAKKAEERYQTADELAADLARVRSRLGANDTARTRRLAATMADEPRPSALMTISDFVRRPRLSPLAFAVAVVAIVGGIWAYGYWRRPELPDPDPRAVVLYEQGVAALRDGAYHRASVALTEAVRVDDAFALAHARLAEAWAEMDYGERAMDEMLKVSSLVSDRSALPEADALYLEAVTATAGREFAQAAAAYQKLAALAPDRPEVLLDLGRAREKNDETVKALAAYTDAAARAPEYATAYLRVGIVHARQQNLPAASNAFTRAERLYEGVGNQEGQAEVLYQRGQLFANTSRLADARRELESALELARKVDSAYQQVQTLMQLGVVAQKENDTARALEGGRAAVELAELRGLSNLTARAYVALGTTYLSTGEYDAAERHFNLALERARAHRVRRFEALALFNLGSLRLKQSRVDEGLQLVEQARQFYQQAGYRKEMQTAMLLIGRTKRQRGDYDGATQTFEELLRLVEPTGDAQQLADTHRELARVHLTRERYPQALAHFRESHAIYKTLGNASAVAHSLLNQAESLWRLGRYEESAAALLQATGDEVKTQGGGEPNAELRARARMVSADAALSRDEHRESEALARDAFELSAQFADVRASAKRTLAVTAAHTGASQRARALSAEAVEGARATGDSWMLSAAQLASAEVLYEAGDDRASIDAASSALERFERSGQMDSELRALVLRARARRRAGDADGARQDLERAAALVSRLEREWGADASTYLARPDVRRLRGELDAPTAAVAATR
ncbi:MAG TPA: tetratricopeptide repeat protein [Pyrinomonadaceae bacterium]|nr:tetratricopeptide repeat protein [Pyrinomonadaceae bacterium]